MAAMGARIIPTSAKMSVPAFPFRSREPPPHSMFQPNLRAMHEIAPARGPNVTIPPSAFPSQTVPIAQPKTTKMPVSNTKRAKVRRYAPMDSHPTEWYLLSTRTSLINLMREGRRGSEAQDVRVSFHVHESVAAHVERDDAALPALLRFEGLIHRACDAVGALRGGQEALRLNEHARPLEHVSLVGRVCDRVAQSPGAQEGGE